MKTRVATAAQWARMDPSRKPEPEGLTLSSRDGGDLVATINGSNLRRSTNDK
jgi:hypothetical protein